MKKINLAILLIIYFFVLVSCRKEKIDESNATGQIEFAFTTNHLKSIIKSVSDSVYSQGITSVVFSIKNKSGNIIKDFEKVEIFNMNGYYLSKPFSLAVGDYELTCFFVLDANNKVIYASPLKESNNAYLVQNPLPLKFSIKKDVVTKIVPEVVSTAENKPEDFGYGTFNFEISNTFDFLIGVFIYNDTIQNYELTNAQLSVFSNNDSLKTFDISGKKVLSTIIFDTIGITNKITLPERYNTFILKILKPGYKTYCDTFKKEELRLYNRKEDKGPMVVLLKKSTKINNGLVAYYPLNGNVKDESGYNNNGTLMGNAKFTPNRFNLNSGALILDSIDDYISINHSPTLICNNAISLCAWIKPNSFFGVGNNSIISKGYYTHDFPYYEYHLGITGDKYPVSNASSTFTFNLSINNNFVQIKSSLIWNPNTWYFLVGTYDGFNIKIYINGKLDNYKSINGIINTYNEPINIGKTKNHNINGNYTPGTIDELRIYNRALTFEEIKILYESSE